MGKEESSPLLEEPDGPRINRPSLENRVSNRNLYFSCLAMLFGAMSMGITLGMSSPMIPDMKKDDSDNAIVMTTSDYTWFGSLVTIGAMAGGICGGGFIQFCGRKLTAMLCGIPFVGGMLIMSYATNVAMLLVGRTITGFATGVVSLAVPTYISETSTKGLRGLLGAGNQLFVTFGIFVAYFLGIFMTWRWLAIACAVPATLLTLCGAFAPETPRYLLVKHRRAEAKKSLRILRGKKADVNTELEEQEEAVGRSVSSVPWLDLLRDRTIRTPLFLSLGVMFFQQAGGINCIMFYSKTIFKDAGFTSESMLNMSMLLTAGLQFVFTGISCFIMDKAGRKVLLVISGAVMALTTGTFGLFFQLTSPSGNATEPGLGSEWEAIASSDAKTLAPLALVSMLVYVSAFAIGLGPIPWLLLSEIVPIRARGKASGLSTGFNWILAFVVTKEFNDMQVAFTTQGTYWIFSGVCLVGVFYHALLLPETKGKTLEEIAVYFERHRAAINVASNDDPI